jgi:hypothetical protein
VPIVPSVIRVAALIWFLFGGVLLLALVAELVDERRPASLLIALVFGVTSVWLGRRLWQQPSLPVVVIAACVAAFVVFIFLVALVQGRVGGMPWSLLVPLMAAAAGLLPLGSRASGR